jgi:thiamine biosynthesis lipoprotein
MNERVEHRVRARPLLGTFVEIAATGAPGRVDPAITQAFAAIAEVQALMSYQDPTSELSRINQFAFEQALAVHAHTWQVLRAARDLSTASDGLFDITIAPTLTRLGFLPRHENFPRVSRHGDWRHVALLPGRHVRFLRRVRIDLSGIAKGYAVDVAIQALQAAGMQAGRVNAGGDLRVFGAAAQTIHVRLPHAPTQAIPVLDLHSGAAATSAAYFAQRRHEQRRVTPLIHPHTRRASSSERSITVLASDCMHADALTKVVQANPARAAQILERYQARALILEHDAVSGGCRIFDSSQNPINKPLATENTEENPRIATLPDARGRMRSQDIASPGISVPSVTSVAGLCRSSSSTI